MSANILMTVYPNRLYRQRPEAGTSNSVRLHHNLCCNFHAMNEVGQTTAPRLSLQILWKLRAVFWTHFASTTTVTQPPSLPCKRPGWDWSLVSSCSHRFTSANLTLTSLMWKTQVELIPIRYQYWNGTEKCKLKIRSQIVQFSLVKPPSQ